MAGEIEKVKISELQDVGESLDGFYTIGTKTVNGTLVSRKAELGFVQRAAANAQEKAGQANAAASAANSAATNATNAAGSANTAATRANTAAAASEADHTQAVADHTQAASDHSTAASDHSTAQSDHTRAASDHTTATGDHSTAQSDHVVAASDHTTAVADHTQAASDHTRAETDHSSMASKDLSSIEVGAMQTHTQKPTTPALKFKHSDGSSEDIERDTPVAISATNLYGQAVTRTNQLFTRRTTAEDGNVDSLANAELRSIKGNTIVWNQLVKNNHNFENTQSWTAIDGTHYSIESSCLKGAATLNYVNFHQLSNRNIAGHKILVKASLYPSFSGRIQLLMYTDLVSYANITANVWNNVSFIGVAGNNGGFQFISPNRTAGDYALLKYISIIDLTLMFGEGNEPSTVEEFEALFPEAYYEYNEGELLSLEMNGIVTDGFNQWDEEWEVGTISGGTPVPSSSAIRSKNFCPCIPSSTMYAKSPNAIYIFFYGIGRDYISYVDAINNAFDVPANAYFFKVNNRASSTYNHDICINLSWSGVRNGEYEPYWKETRNLPVTTIKGKVNGQGESVVIFPDGMKSAGTAHDEIVGNKAIKRIGELTLNGSADVVWVRDGGKDCQILYSSLWGNQSTQFIHNSNLFIREYREGDYRLLCSSYTAIGDISAWKAYFAEHPVTFYYELATPVEYIIDEADTLNLNYKVSDYGTEEIIPQGVDASGVPATAPILADIHYGLNAIDDIRTLRATYARQSDFQRLPKDYQSQQSMDSLLSVLGTALGGTFSKSWDGTKWVFTFTPNA